MGWCCWVLFIFDIAIVTFWNLFFLDANTQNTQNEKYYFLYLHSLPNNGTNTHAHTHTLMQALCVIHRKWQLIIDFLLFRGRARDVSERGRENNDSYQIISNLYGTHNKYTKEFTNTKKYSDRTLTTTAPYTNTHGELELQIYLHVFTNAISMCVRQCVSARVDTSQKNIQTVCKELLFF